MLMNFEGMIVYIKYDLMDGSHRLYIFCIPKENNIIEGSIILTATLEENNF